MALLLISLGVKAQSEPFKANGADKKSLHYTYDNDLFAGYDRYYTQGSIVEIRHPIFASSPIAKFMKRFFHGKSDLHCLSFRQDVFTPRSITNKDIDTTDRPYAGTFMFSQKEISVWYTSRLTTSIDIGCIGPLALGEQMQKFVHKNTKNAEPIGWENQVANSFVANLNAWYEHSLLYSDCFDLLAEGGGKLGNLYTNATAGLAMRVGKKSEIFASDFIVSHPNWELYSTFKGCVTSVFYNSVLQGAPFTKNIYVLNNNSIERFVYRLDAAVTFSIRKVSCSYTHTFLTPEFNGGSHHSWGGINFVYRF